VVNRRPDKRRFFFDALVLISFAVALAVWLAIVARRLPINYDEFTQVHAAWQVAQGRAPYQDFHAVHPPFLWILYAPLVKILPESLHSIVVLRTVHLAFSVASVVLLAAILWKRFPGRPDRYLALGAVAVLCLQPWVVQVLAEFRADHLAAGLTFLGLWLSATPRNSPRSGWIWAAAAFAFTAAAVLTAKLIVIPAVLFGLIGPAELKKRGPAARTFIVGLAAGTGAALVLLGGLCALNGIDLGRLYEQVFAYHADFARGFASRFGLASRIGADMREPFSLLTPLFLLGLGVLVHELRQGRWRENAAVLALALYAVIQPLWVPFYFRQYAYSVYLAWAGPAALFWVRLSQAGYRKAAVGILLAALSLSVMGEARRRRPDFADPFLPGQIEFGDTLIRLAPRDRPVAAAPPFHPIFRDNSTFAWIYSSNAGGPDSEDVMARFPGYEERFSVDGILQDLRQKPPGLIVSPREFAGRRYKEAVQRFIDENPGLYESRRFGQIEVHVRREPGA
jgi:hypothetical protein